MNRMVLDAPSNSGWRGRAIDAPPESVLAAGHGALDAVPSTGEPATRGADHEAER